MTRVGTQLAGYACWTVVVTIGLAGLVAAATDRQVRLRSTPEDRKAASAMAKILEHDPLNPKAKESRTWFLFWIASVPDIRVSFCPKLLGSTERDDKPFGPEIQFQQLLSSTAYMIDHPESMEDDVAVYTAGVRGSMRCYQSLLEAHPDVRRPYLDALVEDDRRGELPVRVKERLKECKISHLPAGNVER